MVLVSVRSCWFRLKFHFKSTLNWIVQFMIQRKDGEFSLPGFKKHKEKLFPFIWATINLVESLLQEIIVSEIISDKSNSEAMFVRIKTDVLHDIRSGADPGFFLGGGAPLRNGVTDWWPDVNTSCIRKPQVISEGWGWAPLTPSP